MNPKEVLSIVDHTLLHPDAVWEDFKEICDDAVQYQTASVCIPPSRVSQAVVYLENRIPVCTVVGFPNGYSTDSVKQMETKDAIANGAAEIDMVINIGLLKEGQMNLLAKEVESLKRICGSKILKVIIETALLSEQEKIAMCKLVTTTGADFIKTSTGFSKGGATIEDIQLFASYVGKGVGIKAAGGIRSFSDAEAMIRAGATRLGTSSLIKLLKGKGLLNY